MNNAETERKWWPVTCLSHRRRWAPSHPATWHGKERPPSGLGETTFRCLFTCCWTRGPSVASLHCISYLTCPRPFTRPLSPVKGMTCVAYTLTPFLFGKLQLYQFRLWHTIILVMPSCRSPQCSLWLTMGKWPRHWAVCLWEKLKLPLWLDRTAKSDQLVSYTSRHGKTGNFVSCVSVACKIYCICWGSMNVEENVNFFPWMNIFH